MDHRPRSQLSRKSSMASRVSTKSRNSQLIKKNTGPNDLRPSDVLCARFQAWKRLVKNLIAYFEGIADIENNTAKELTKLGGVIQVPFREGNQFLGEGGVQDIFWHVREKTRHIADSHANLAKTVEGSILQHLQKLKIELKAHIRNIQQDTGKLAENVARERELSTKLITDLARSITMLKNTPLEVGAKEDPWLTNSLVAQQLQKQVHEENALQKSIIIMQQNSEYFEEGVVRAIQMAWSTFDEWNARASSQVQETWAVMGSVMRSVAPTTEWLAFSSRAEYLLDPDTPLRNPMTINYPGKDDPSVVPVQMGILERKKPMSGWKERFYVLTPAGYLHEHLSSDLQKHPNPVMSLFLPECTLGAPTTAHSKVHKFYVEGKKHLGGNLGQKNGFGPRVDVSFSFRARSNEELMEWWNDCKQLSKVYLTASEPFDRSGPVPAAVRAAGYVEESESEEEGSSVEEETEEDSDEDYYRDAQGHYQGHPQQQKNIQQEQLAAGGDLGQLGHANVGHLEEVPAYTGPPPGSVQVDENGYALEKKRKDLQVPKAPGRLTSSSPNERVPQDSDDEEEDDDAAAEDADGAAKATNSKFHENLST